MALFLSSAPNLSHLSRQSPKDPTLPLPKPQRSHLSFTTSIPQRFPSLASPSAAPPGANDDSKPPRVTDEWGEEAEPESVIPLAAPVVDEPVGDDEWGNGAGARQEEDVDMVGDLKRCVVDSLYGLDLGFGASAEARAEILELVGKLEALNPTPAPVEAPELDGNWILLYTASSELLPLIAVGSTPFLKVKEISQVIDTKNLSIINLTTLSSPFATFKLSASAVFEVRSPSRIQVQFKEGIFDPPMVSSTIDLPANIDVFGQKIDLSPVKGALNPIQEVAASIARGLSGQPPLKVPIPGDRSTSWLLTTYLDKDFRISRGDGGLFVLAKEGSPLLDQLY